MQDFFRCEEGYDQMADQTARSVCRKLVKDMHYEARVQAVIDYWAEKIVRVKKAEARTMMLTREQYLSVHITSITIVSETTYYLIFILLMLCR